MNEYRTCADGDTGLTQPHSDFVPTPESIGAMAVLTAKAAAQGTTRFFSDPIHIRRELIVKREAAGADTPIGHGCSNVIEMLDNLYGYERPAWATHESQTLPYQIERQMKRLEALKAASH